MYSLTYYTNTIYVRNIITQFTVVIFLLAEELLTQRERWAGPREGYPPAQNISTGPGLIYWPRALSTGPGGQGSLLDTQTKTYVSGSMLNSSEKPRGDIYNIFPGGLITHHRLWPIHKESRANGQGALEFVWTTKSWRFLPRSPGYLHRVMCIPRTWHLPPPHPHNTSLRGACRG